MEIEAVLRRVGAEIVKERTGETDAALFLRVDPDQGSKWVDALTRFLVGAAGKPFSPDVSKYFYAQDNEIRYLWRIHLSGDVAAAVEALRIACVEGAMARGVELTSYPLVGRISYPIDPARGKLKGAHHTEQASTLVGMAANGGVPGGVA